MVTGHIDVVLVPGRWVFSLDSRKASSVTAYLQGSGVEVIELPRPREADERADR